MTIIMSIICGKFHLSDPIRCSSRTLESIDPRCSGGSWIFKANLERSHIMCQFQQLKASRLNVWVQHMFYFHRLTEAQLSGVVPSECPQLAAL